MLRTLLIMSKRHFVSFGLENDFFFKNNKISKNLWVRLGTVFPLKLRIIFIFFCLLNTCVILLGKKNYLVEQSQTY